MVICSPQLGLSPNSTLGGEVFDREILLGLAKKGVRIEIVMPRRKKHDKGIKNWNITELPISHFPAILGNFIYLPYLFLIYKRTKFGILRIHQPQFLGFAALIFKFFHKNVKLVATYHQFRETRFIFMSKAINNHWDHIICDSENVKRKIIGTYSVKADKITVVHNGVPSYLKPQKKNQKLVKKLGVENKKVLLFMGMFIERKNPLFLFEVVKKLVAKNKNVVLIFWGEGSLKKKMIKMVKIYKLGKNIIFQKPLFGKEKNKIHNLADIFLHPAIDEGFALAPLEAMACAKPVIMNDSHSAREAIDNDLNGYVCKNNDLKDWVLKITLLIENKKTLKFMGQKSLGKSQTEFSWKIATLKHIELFNKLSS
jgi:spore coat protein SA